MYTVPFSYDQEESLGFQFGNLEDGAVIKVSFSELISPIPGWLQPEVRHYTFEDEDNTAVCLFGLSPILVDGAENRMMLGLAFLRSAYIAFDHDEMTVGLASARWNATESNIVKITEEGLGSAVTVSAASVSAIVFAAGDKLEPRKMGSKAGNSSDLGKPSAAASTLKSGVGHTSKPTSTESAASHGSSAAAAPAVTEQSSHHIVILALSGSITLVAAMLF